MAVTVTNTGGAPISSWKVDLPFAGAVDSIWNAKSASSAGHIIASNESYNGALAAGATASFGLTASYSGSPASPSACTAVTSAGPAGCAIGAASTSPTPTPTPTTPTPTPTPTTATPTPSPTATTPVPPVPSDFKVAPYVDMAAWPTPDLSAMKSATGISNFTLGFITSSSGCTPGWGGYASLGVNSTDPQAVTIANGISAVKAGGGDVIVSLGGAYGTELAISCTDVTSLKNAYRSIVDKYSLTRIDFDIEGGAQGDHAANARRSQAVKALQTELAAAGRPLTVSFTLPVLVSGLTADGLGVLNDSVPGGMRIDLVNVMAMDYGGPNYAMGQSAIDAATNTANQLTNIYPGTTAAQRLGHVGVTPLIGENDVADEVFTKADAIKVGTWAKSSGVGMLAWWSMNRDTPCANNAKVSAPYCTGTTNPTWAYAKAFTTLA